MWRLCDACDLGRYNFKKLQKKVSPLPTAELDMTPVGNVERGEYLVIYQRASYIKLESREIPVIDVRNLKAKSVESI